MQTRFASLFFILMTAAVASQAQPSTIPRMRRRPPVSPERPSEYELAQSTSLHTTLTTPVSSEEKVFGRLELRPSWDGENGNHFFDHERVEFGYQWSSRFKLSYLQDFVSFYKKENGAEFFDGCLRIQAPDLIRDPSVGFSLSYEGRVGLPTFGIQRNAGYLFSIGNSIRIDQELTSWLGLRLTETATFYTYSRAGFEVTNLTEEGEARTEANPWFENRVYFGPEMKFFNKRVVLSVPIVFRTTAFRDYRAVAKNNDQWLPAVGFFPELLVNVSDYFYLGANYESGSLVKSDYFLWNFSDGLRTGITQLIFGFHL